MAFNTPCCDGGRCTMPDADWHGKGTGYTNHKCRCERCREWRRIKGNQQAAAAAATRRERKRTTATPRKSAAQWARDVTKSETHIRVLYKVAQSTAETRATLSFNEVYQRAAEGPRPPRCRWDWPTCPPGRPPSWP